MRYCCFLSNGTLATGPGMKGLAGGTAQCGEGRAEGGIEGSIQDPGLERPSGPLFPTSDLSLQFFSWLAQ